VSGDSFFHLDHIRTLAGSRKLAEWDHDKMESALEVIKCPKDPGHQRGGKRLTNLSVVLPNGEVQDFIWTWQSECIMQARTLEILRSNGLTGFEVKPVVARFRKSIRRPPPLWELVVTEWAGCAKPESGIHLNDQASCHTCAHLKYTGLSNPRELIDKKVWDGSDFFMVWPLPRYVFVSERVVKTLQDHHLTGVQIVSASDLKMTDGFTPGRLRYYMPDARARELGEPLGIY